MARRKAKRKPAHMKALETPYEDYVALTGGEYCGICKTPRRTKRHSMMSGSSS